MKTLQCTGAENAVCQRSLLQVTAFDRIFIVRAAWYFVILLLPIMILQITSINRLQNRQSGNFTCLFGGVEHCGAERHVLSKQTQCNSVSQDP